MTNLAITNGKIIVKDGKLAESCGCCGECKCIQAVFDFLGGANGGVYGERTISIPDSVVLPCEVTITGTVDDDLLINGSIIQENQYGFYGGPNPAHSLTYTFTSSSRTFSVAAKDNYGANARYNLTICFNKGACLAGSSCSVVQQCECVGEGKRFCGVGTTCAGGDCDIGLCCGPEQIPIESGTDRPVIRESQTRAECAARGGSFREDVTDFYLSQGGTKVCFPPCYCADGSLRPSKLILTLNLEPYGGLGLASGCDRWNGTWVLPPDQSAICDMHYSLGRYPLLPLGVSLSIAGTTWGVQFFDQSWNPGVPWPHCSAGGQISAAAARAALCAGQTLVYESQTTPGLIRMKIEPGGTGPLSQ